LLSGYIDRRQSRWEKSLEEMKRALELDPRNFSILQQISLTYEALRRYKEMAATLDGALAISPKDVPSRVRRAWVDLEWRADPKPMHATIDTILAEDPNAAPVLVNQWLDLALWERDPAAAERALAGMPADGGGCYAENIPFPNCWCEGLAARFRGVEGAMLVQYLAVIYAWTGDKDRAIDGLTEAAKLPGGVISYGDLRLNPFWDPLRGDPRFEAIVASLAPK